MTQESPKFDISQDAADAVLKKLDRAAEAVIIYQVLVY